MEATRQNLERERARAIKEQTPMAIQECKVCKKIMPTESFSKAGKRNRICRVCSQEKLKVWKGEGGGEKNRASRIYQRSRSRARKNGIESRLTLSEFKDWFERETNEGVCFYCQHPLDLANPNSLQGITLDRMDNTKGYEVGNMVLACRRCNVIKGSWFSFEEMIEIAEKYLVGR